MSMIESRYFGPVEKMFVVMFVCPTTGDCSAKAVCAKSEREAIAIRRAQVCTTYTDVYVISTDEFRTASEIRSRVMRLPLTHKEHAPSD